MSDENEFNEESDGIKSLRKAYETTQKQNQELLERLGKYEAQERQSAVANVLKAKGLSANAAKLYHGEDVSEEAVGKWLEEFADVFGSPSGGSDDANAANAQRVSAASGGASDGVATEAGGQMLIGDPAEMLHAMQTLPYEELQKRGYMPQSGTLFSR